MLFTQVIPRVPYRGRNRSSSAKFTSNASLLPTANVAVRSNSFRVHRNPIQQHPHQQQHVQQQPRNVNNFQPSFNSNNINNNNLNTTGSVDSINFCKHTLYCCLHQQQNQQQQQQYQQQSQSSHVIVNPSSELDLKSASIMQMKFNELVNPNFSDDEKSSFRSIHRKLSADSANFIKAQSSDHFHNKSSSSQQLMSSYNFHCNIEDNCGKFERVFSTLFKLLFSCLFSLSSLLLCSSSSSLLSIRINFRRPH